MKNSTRCFLLLLSLSLFGVCPCVHAAEAAPVLQGDLSRVVEVHHAPTDNLLAADERDAREIINHMSYDELKTISGVLRLYYSGRNETGQSSNLPLSKAARIACVVGKYATLAGVVFTGGASHLLLGDIVIRLLGWDSWSAVQQMYAPSAQWSWYKRVGYCLGADISSLVFVLANKFCDKKLEADNVRRSNDERVARINRVQSLVDECLQELEMVQPGLAGQSAVCRR